MITIRGRGFSEDTIWEALQEYMNCKKHWRIGDKVKNKLGGDCIIAQVSSNKCCIIGLTEGNRFKDPINVQNIIRISESEFVDMGGEV